MLARNSQAMCCVYRVSCEGGGQGANGILHPWYFVCPLTHKNWTYPVVYLLPDWFRSQNVNPEQNVDSGIVSVWKHVLSVGGLLSIILLQVLGYFFLCEWLVPFSLFISLSANDMTLPTTTELCKYTVLHRVLPAGTREWSTMTCNERRAVNHPNL